jgi:hypothetical protein
MQQLLTLCLNKNDRLSGEIIAYAKISLNAPDLKDESITKLNDSGILAVKGSYKNQHSLRDFLTNEFGDEAAEKMDGILETLNTKEDQTEIIPVPARIMSFNSEEELLKRSEDIFFLGNFERASNAQLSISAFPILYQSAFREQEVLELQDQINAMINPTAITTSPQLDLSILNFKTYPGVLSELLAKTIIPDLIHASSTPNAFQERVLEFKAFMQGYPYHNDLNSIESLSRACSQRNEDSKKILELLCLKIEAQKNERFAEVRRLQARIESLSLDSTNSD